MPSFISSIVRLLSKSFKWLGGGLGWLLGGPLGGVLGFVGGTVIDSFSIKKEKKKPIGDFSTNLIMILAAVVKADRPAVNSEEDLVKFFLKNNYGINVADEAFIHFNEILKQKIPLESACTKVRGSLDYSSRVQLMQFLYKLAKIDGGLTDTEQQILNVIAAGLRLKQAVESPIVQNDAIIAAYSVLGVNHTANVIEIKKAYRKLANEFHPDKVLYLDENKKKTANERFLELTRAYEAIKKEKNFS